MNKSKRAVIALLFLCSILFLTQPDKDDIYDWLEHEQGITQRDDSNEAIAFGLFKKDGKQIQEMFSHYRNTGLFASEEKVFYDENGESFTIRVFGIAGQLFLMEEGPVWDWLNN
ncbi:hypothetical protein SAMN04488102_10746 [Alkalibacterium subtropicum]|uniref:DUF4359 domain-containing protein n=1 Tax=Alkalibacterium subtropicum TaxID=753702 RepID=A0A1I1JAR6_9LACT|nr:hypothetical protein [Alkalibacterium subtropicum]SFC45465.1 hypothetical protein SAMN04488102_10746 [Alkalibacterium subtropicum]